MSGSIDFSIIIPTRDRPGQLAECLQSVARLETQSSRFQVIVVDDGSASSLEPVVEPFRDRMDITLWTQEGRGPAAARNAGAKRARGAFLAFTDDDCSPAADWLEKIAARVDSLPDGIVGGRTINTLHNNPFSTASQDLVNYLYDYYNTDSDNARFLTSNNMAVPARSFNAVGGFDPRYPKAAAEDRDFCDRWRATGRRMAFASEAVVYHRHHLDPKTFWNQHFNYGRGAFRFQRERSRRSGEHQRFEPFAFYLEMARYPFRLGRGAWSPVLSALFIVSQVGNSAGFFWERGRQLLAANRS
jgi:GT2 family glycosyltransferase